MAYIVTFYIWFINLEFWNFRIGSNLAQFCIELTFLKGMFQKNGHMKTL